MIDPDPFDDGKEGGALRTIGEIGRALGLKAHVLRYWEQQFPTLQPLKRSGGRRYYRTEDVALLRRIDRMVNHEGYTIRGARAVIEGRVIPAGRQEAARDVTASSRPAGTPREAGRNSDVTADLSRAALVARLQAVRAKLVQALD